MKSDLISYEEAREKVKQWWVRLFWRKRTLYNRVFGTVEGKEVLADLAVICHATESTFRKTERETLIQEGKRQVWLRIQQFLQLTEKQLWEIKKGEIDVRSSE